MSEESSMCPAEKDIREVWRKVPGDFYSPSIHVFGNGEAIRIDVGGSVITMSIEAWHRAGSFDMMELRAENAALSAKVEELELSATVDNSLVRRLNAAAERERVLREALELIARQAKLRETWGISLDIIEVEAVCALKATPPAAPEKGAP